MNAKRTFLIWLPLVLAYAVYCVWHYTVTPSAEWYTNSVSFQIIAFLYARLPACIVVLLVALAVQAFWNFLARCPLDRTRARIMRIALFALVICSLLLVAFIAWLGPVKVDELDVLDFAKYGLPLLAVAWMLLLGASYTVLRLTVRRPSNTTSRPPSAPAH